MREILFRGKRIEDGEWVYGSLIVDYITGKIFIHALGNSVNDSDKVGEEGVLKFLAFGVDPETVGQYTGLKDKNGKRIYEGHILHKDSHCGWYVAFEDGAFCRIPINNVQRINWEHYRMKQKNVEDWEIIGNIHEVEVWE